MAREFYTADRVNLNEVRYGIIEGIAAWTSQPLALQELLTKPASMQAYKRDNSRLRWMKTSEQGRAMLGEKTFEVVTPTFDVYGWEEGWTIEGLAMKAAMDVLQETKESLIAHDELVIGKIVEKCFAETGGAWNAGGGTYDVPAPYLNNTFDATHTHLLRQSAISLANVVTNRKLLREHGYNKIIVMCHTNEYTTILNELQAIGSDSNAKVSNPVSIAALQGEITNLRGMSFVESDYIPSGYYLMLATGFGMGDAKPLRMHEIPGLEGIIFQNGKGGLHPLDGASMKHDFGLTTEHRGAIVAVKIADSGSYAAPSLNYTVDA